MCGQTRGARRAALQEGAQVPRALGGQLSPRCLSLSRLPGGSVRTPASPPVRVWRMAAGPPRGEPSEGGICPEGFCRPGECRIAGGRMPWGLSNGQNLGKSERGGEPHGSVSFRLFPGMFPLKTCQGTSHQFLPSFLSDFQLLFTWSEREGRTAGPEVKIKRGGMNVWLLTPLACPAVPSSRLLCWEEGHREESW